MPSPWLALLAVLLAETLWAAFTRKLGRFGVSPEWARKLFHAGNGLILLSFPLLFDETWPVLIWAAIAVLPIYFVTHMPRRLQRKLAGNVYDVGRESYGDYYFVAGVAILFFMSRENPYTYYVPLSILTFADAAGALVGRRFGRHKFEATEGRKSIEGSAAFFLVAFAAVVLWMPALPNADPVHVLLTATILGFVVMLLEAIAWRGLDNLLIPLGGFLLLRTLLMMDVRTLLIDLVVIALLSAFVLAWRDRTTLKDSALITAALFGYLVWVTAGAMFGAGPLSLPAWTWLGIPVLLFVGYNLLFAPQLMEERHQAHNVDAIFSAVFAASVWLYAAFISGRGDFVIPYAGAFAAVAANMYAEQRMASRWARRWPVMLGTTAVALGMLALALLAYFSLDATIAPSLSGALLLAAGLAAGTLVSVGLRLLAEKLTPGERLGQRRWMIRGAASLAGSLIAAAPLLLLPAPEHMREAKKNASPERGRHEHEIYLEVRTGRPFRS